MVQRPMVQHQAVALLGSIGLHDLVGHTTAMTIYPDNFQKKNAEELHKARGVRAVPCSVRRRHMLGALHEAPAESAE